MVARSIVKSSMLAGGFFTLIIPESIRNAYNLSFEKAKIRQATIVHDRPAFDLVRASANLVIASSLIALATSYKLPLSTTYVSFMVAMGTSLADKAWGRETAVYRVAGVLSVIGGWFVTAAIAFSVSALFVSS
jgi:phosphate/sulfate permease